MDTDRAPFISITRAPTSAANAWQCRGNPSKLLARCAMPIAHGTPAHHRRQPRRCINGLPTPPHPSGRWSTRSCRDRPCHLPGMPCRAPGTRPVTPAGRHRNRSGAGRRRMRFMRQTSSRSWSNAASPPGALWLRDPVLCRHDGTSGSSARLCGYCRQRCTYHA